MNEAYCYEVDLTWNTITQGTLSAPLITKNIEVVTPPEFPNGITGKWTPEHLFVASLNACLMSTFLLVADNSKLDFISFDCHAIGKIEKVGGRFEITEITLNPKLVITFTEDEAKAKRILEMSEKTCAIANSIKTKIVLNPTVEIQ